MRKFLTFVTLLCLLTGCAEIASLLPTPAPAPEPTGTPIPITATATLPSPTVTPGGPQTLRIWVPPQFDPFAGTAVGDLLKERLDEFVSRRPGLRIDVRVKAEDGTSSLLNALAITKSAAPTVMPDIVALSRPDLESAITKGLLHPLDELTDLPDGSDWYPYARQMARVQDASFGLPFAGDALALAGFRNPLLSSWTDVPEETLFLFPADDPQALFTLTLYLSAGGTLQDSQGRLILDRDTLTEVLSLYVPSTEKSFISSQSINYGNDEQAWAAFREERGNLVLTWISRYLNDDTNSLALAPLPGLETGHYTLATGWSWALAGSAPENQALAVELAEFLSDSRFLGEWTQAAGYLPTRPSSLSSWEDVNIQLVLTQAAESALLVPDEDVLITVGPILSEAVLSVLNGAQDPAEAAQAAIDKTR